MSSQQFIEKAAAAEWQRSPELQHEFMRFETYLAYRKATHSVTARTQAPVALEADPPTRKTDPVALDLLSSHPWAITADMMENLWSVAGNYENAQALATRAGAPLQSAPQVSLHGSVAVLPIVGPVFRYSNMFTQLFGMPSLDTLALNLSTALDDQKVSNIILNIDSPGGQVTGIAEFATMVRNSRKPVAAFVGGTATSAGYWIASAARDIVASRTAMLGGIGVVLGVRADKDPSRIEIVSSQSPNKRPDVTTERGRSQIQTMIDDIAQVFINDVAAYRNVSTNTVLTKFGQGGILMGADAVKAGMANRVGTLADLINSMRKAH